jgi:tetratricopeptide (TPR) repeat protein
MTLLNLGILAMVALAVWWLTGKDKSWDGQSKRDRHFTRSVRTVGVVFLFYILLLTAEGDSGPASAPLMIIIPIGIALILRSSISEVFAGGFMRFLDPALHDSREIDLKRAQRHRDNIAWLIHHGKRDEAVKLCEELKINGELDEATLAHTLEFLGVKQDFGKITDPLNEAARLRAQGKFAEAEAFLKARLKKQPADSGAALMLMRIYAENLQQPEAAARVLAALEKEPHVPPEHLEFARRSLAEWRRPGPKVSMEEVLPPSLEEMLEQGFYGSAIELLEEKIKAQPRDLDLRLKLAEIHALHCNNLPRAEKIVKLLGAEKLFSGEQVAAAEIKLKEWRERQLPLK